MRAVIFDLWDTLVEWPEDEGSRLVERLAALAQVPLEEFERRLRASFRTLQTGPLSAAYRGLGFREPELSAALDAHHELARRALRLRAGAAEALVALRRRGVKLGVITVCSEDVPVRWPDSELAPHFDAVTFSSECGLMKPEREIYLRTARALGVAPSECLFVGDGANDELAGAERVGMRPVLFLPEGTTPRWDEVRFWHGLRVSAVAQVSELC